VPGHDIVVIGASAGGVEALSKLVSRLPRDLPAALLVVLHVPANGTSVLPMILSRAGPLPAVHARDGQAIELGHIYCAPPDHHLLVGRGHLRVARGPRENGLRPAADPLFRTAARVYGPRVIGVVLSGSLDDGTAGLYVIKARGGFAITQDPEEAMFSGMPRSAVENVAVDHCLPVAEIAPLLDRLTREPVAEEGVAPVPDEMEIEVGMAELDPAALQSDDRPGQLSGFSCPECNGVLWELRDGELLRFRCRVGHAYSANSLVEAQSEALEAALWAALRALEEQAALAHRLMIRSRDRGHDLAAARFEQQVRDSEERAALIRDVLLRKEPVSAGDPAATDTNIPTQGTNP
jgi:two-component system chemotaxis response regulator CheB